MKTETAAPVSATKSALLSALRAWINQRPGLDYANYGDPASYRAEVRGITRQRADALQLLRYAESRDSITAEDIAAGFSAYSGRLSFAASPTGAVELAYCAGQYWCTEYRAAACAVLARVLWGYFWAHRMPAPDAPDARKSPEGYDRFRGLSAGEFLRKTARAEFGRGIQSRWFA